MNSSETPNGDNRDFYFGDPPAFSVSEPAGAAPSPASGQAILLSDLAAHRAYFTRIGLAVLVLTLAYQGFATVVSFVIAIVAPEMANAWWYSWVLTDVSLYGVGLPCMWLILRSVPSAPHNATYRAKGGIAPKPRFGLGWWAVIAVIGMGLMQIGGLIGQWTMDLLSLLTGYDYANGLQDMVDSSPLWASVLGTVVLAPLGEEFIFRKLLIDRTRRYGDTVSILLSGFLFGLFHGNLFQFFYAFMIGCLLAYVYTRSGKLGWCIGLHALMNFMGGTLPTLLQEWIGRDVLNDAEKLTEHMMQNPVQYLVYMLYVMMIYATMIAAVVLLICLRKQVKLGNGEYCLPARRRFRTVILNIGMLAAIVIGLVILLSNLLLPVLLSLMPA